MPDIKSIREEPLSNDTKTREKGYSIPMKGSHGKHWYGETGIGLGQRRPPKQETSVDPTAQAYVAGRVQLSNLQKLAERQSCYSGSKKNLVEDKRMTRKQPTRKSEGKLHRTKPW